MEERVGGEIFEKIGRWLPPEGRAKQFAPGGATAHERLTPSSSFSEPGSYPGLKRNKVSRTPRRGAEQQRVAGARKGTGRRDENVGRVNLGPAKGREQHPWERVTPRAKVLAQFGGGRSA